LQVFRHGPRTPADTYPRDPYVNETYYPFGWGQVTNVSRKQVAAKLLPKKSQKKEDAEEENLPALPFNPKTAQQSI